MSHEEGPIDASSLRVALVYDCLFPWTVGGAERWYRDLADRLALDGHEVTYVTRQQWSGDPPAIPGVRVVAVSGPDELYDRDGTRRVLPTVRFGAGLLRYLLRHRLDFDVVQTANFPFWSVIAARIALAWSKVPLVVDWHEIWSLRFWREYSGAVTGVLGFVVQRLCIALSSNPVVTSPLNAQRFLAASGHYPDVLPGFFPTLRRDRNDAVAFPSDPPYILFVGRHILDKGVDLLPGLAVELQRRVPALQLVIAGDGPQRRPLEKAIAAAGVASRVRFTGFVEQPRLERLIASAVAVVVPSRREGYGMVVVEAAALGVPVVVAAFQENLAVGHIDPGVNGFVASPDTGALAEAVAEVHSAGQSLRESTAAWFAERSATATMEQSLERVLALHHAVAKKRPQSPLAT